MGGRSVCVVYDTKRGSTAVIAEWIAEVLCRNGCEVSLIRACRAPPPECGFVVIGAPVYYERPLQGIPRFLEDNEAWIRGRRFAVFVVCTVPEALRGYAYRHYAGPIVARIEKAGGAVADIFLAQGWFRRPPKNARENVEKWAQSLANTLCTPRGSGKPSPEANTRD